MYATVRRYEGVTNPREAGRRVDEGFVPLISQIPGFVAYYWVDAGGGVMISTTVYQGSSRRAGIQPQGRGVAAAEQSSPAAPKSAPDHGG